jgi:hypothetical protein
MSRRGLSADDVEATFDDWIFTTVVGGVASLSLVVHVAASTIGLSLTSGVVLLALWHLGLWMATRRVIAHSRGPQGIPGLFEIVAASVFVGTLISWVSLSAASLEVTGPDAAHSLVLNAINLAKGASPFDLPATSHLDPLAPSAVAAWFILPSGDLHFVDLAMALPFLVIGASINVIFRASTGLSGLAWGSWLTLLLFSTPTFRASSDGSMDLWLAAGSTAAVAVIVRAWSAGTWRKVDVILLGGAIGLLVGSNSTGVPMAGLLLASGVVAAFARRVAGAPAASGTRLGLSSFVTAAALAIGAGGVWLIRNWVQFGSPLASAGLGPRAVTIFEGETHQQTTLALGLVALLVLDLLLTGGRRRADGRWWARAGGLFVTIAAGGVLGLTLRDVLPVFALLAAFAFAAAFPLRWPWFERWPATLAIQAVLCGASVLRFAESASSTGPSAPPFSVAWTGAALVIVAVVFVLSWNVGRKVLVASAVALLVGLSLTGHARMLGGTANDKRAFFDERSRYDTATPANPWRAALWAVISDESARRQPCATRRFFSLTENGLPLALQPPGVSSRIFYAGHDVESARQAGPIGRCDYIVTTPAFTATEKGRQLIEALAAGAALETMAPAPSLMVLRVR